MEKCNITKEYCNNREINKSFENKILKKGKSKL